MKRIVSLILVLTLAFSLAVPAAAADDLLGTTVRLKNFEGTVTVKDAAGQAKTARADLRLYNGYVVETGKSSTAYISLDDTKAIKLGSSGKVEIRKNGKQLEVYLSAGELLANVTEKLAVGASMNISTANFVTGIRGTVVGVSAKGVQEYAGSTSTVVFPKGDRAQPIDVPLEPGQKLNVEKILGVVEQALNENKSPEEVQQKLEEAAQPEVLTQEDISANTAEEFANNPELASRVAEALENAGSDVNVDQAVEDLPELQAAEAAAEQQAQQQVDEALQQQQQQIESSSTATPEGTAIPGVESSATPPASTPVEEPRERIYEPVEEPTQPTQPAAGGSGVLTVKNNLGTYNAWLTDGSSGLPDYVAQANVYCHPFAGDTTSAQLKVSLYLDGTFSDPANGIEANALCYGKVRFAFKPASPLSAAPTITAVNESTSAGAAVQLSSPQLQSDGSYVVTCANPLTSDFPSVTLGFTVTTPLGNQFVDVNVAYYSGSGSSDSPVWESCDNWDTLRSYLADGTNADGRPLAGVSFFGSEPLTGALTLSGTPVEFPNGLTIAEGATLTLANSPADADNRAFTHVTGNLVNNGTIVLGDRCTLQVAVPYSVNNLSAFTAPTLTNSRTGSIRFGGSGSELQCVGVSFANNGTIRGASGRVYAYSDNVYAYYDDGTSYVGESASLADLSHREMTRLPAATWSYKKVTPTLSGSGTCDTSVYLDGTAFTGWPAPTVSVTVTSGSDGITVSGTGRMKDYTANSTERTWSTLGNVPLVIGSGITYIGAYAFADMVFSSITIPASVTELGRCAFQGVSAEIINYGGTEAQWESLMESYGSARDNGALTDGLQVICSDTPTYGIAFPTSNSDFRLTFTTNTWPTDDSLYVLITSADGTASFGDKVVQSMNMIDFPTDASASRTYTKALVFKYNSNNGSGFSVSDSALAIADFDLAKPLVVSPGNASTSPFPATMNLSGQKSGTSFTLSGLTDSRFAYFYQPNGDSWRYPITVTQSQSGNGYVGTFTCSGGDTGTVFAMEGGDDTTNSRFSVFFYQRNSVRFTETTP